MEHGLTIAGRVLFVFRSNVFLFPSPFILKTQLYFVGQEASWPEACVYRVQASRAIQGSSRPGHRRPEAEMTGSQEETFLCVGW